MPNTFVQKADMIKESPTFFRLQKNFLLYDIKLFLNFVLHMIKYINIFA